MALPAWADVISIAGGTTSGDGPAFAAMDVASQTAILNYATNQLDPAVWGTLLNEGIVYLAAHMAKLGLNRGAGAVTSESVGPLSRSYAAPRITGRSLSAASLELTAYGLEFLSLLRTTTAALGLVP